MVLIGTLCKLRGRNTEEALVLLTPGAAWTTGANWDRGTATARVLLVRCSKAGAERSDNDVVMHAYVAL
jgi:hypothetical protein